MVLISQLLSAYIIFIIARIVLSWVTSIGILKSKPWIVSFDKLVRKLVDPITGLLKTYLPFLVQGSFDFSPFVLILILEVVQIYVLPLLAGLV